MLCGTEAAHSIFPLTGGLDGRCAMNAACFKRELRRNRCLCSWDQALTALAFVSAYFIVLDYLKHLELVHLTKRAPFGGHAALTLVSEQVERNIERKGISEDCVLFLLTTSFHMFFYCAFVFVFIRKSVLHCLSFEWLLLP